MFDEGIVRMNLAGIDDDGLSQLRRFFAAGVAGGGTSDGRELAAKHLPLIDEELAARENARLSREDVRPYEGSRHCLSCPETAKWDVAGFLSCPDAGHLGRAAEALSARRAEQERQEAASDAS